MVVGGSQQESLDLGFVPLGTCQEGVSVILKEPMLSDGLDPVSLSFTVRDFRDSSSVCCFGWLILAWFSLKGKMNNDKEINK
ncbi:unnamed protein product [Schistosoma margrebowiei]|uniref:Uncharacterized protein n=1 Tax=Schistosoma margrebowiei TaxID=48269 RepID=A0A183LAU2_9TREM|nr:unnamed protein product [Schistosoma margrebowiei]